MDRQIEKIEDQLSEYPEVMSDTDQYMQYERKYDQYLGLLDIYSDVIDDFNCLIEDGPAYTGIADCAHIPYESENIAYFISAICFTLRILILCGLDQGSTNFLTTKCEISGDMFI